MLRLDMDYECKRCGMVVQDGRYGAQYCRRVSCRVKAWRNRRIKQSPEIIRPLTGQVCASTVEEKTL
jgi:hypothetical protein